MIALALLTAWISIAGLAGCLKVSLFYPLLRCVKLYYHCCRVESSFRTAELSHLGGAVDLYGRPPRPTRLNLLRFEMLRDDALGGRARVYLAAEHGRENRLHGAVARQLAGDVVTDTALHRLDDLVSQAVVRAAHPLVGFEHLMVLLACDPKLVDADALRRDRLEHGRLPAPTPFFGSAERQHDLEIRHRLMRAWPIRHVDDETVGDLEQARLDRLDAVAEAGDGHDDDRVGDLHYLELDLPDADGLDEDDVAAERVERADDVAGRGRQPARAASRRHAPDEDARVAGVPLHADAIAEDRPAGERTRRIDGDDADAPTFLADERGEDVD